MRGDRGKRIIRTMVLAAGWLFLWATLAAQAYAWRAPAVNPGTSYRSNTVNLARGRTTARRVQPRSRIRARRPAVKGHRAPRIQTRTTVRPRPKIRLPHPAKAETMRRRPNPRLHKLPIRVQKQGKGGILSRPRTQQPPLSPSERKVLSLPRRGALNVRPHYSMRPLQRDVKIHLRERVSIEGGRKGRHHEGTRHWKGQHRRRSGVRHRHYHYHYHFWRPWYHRPWIFWSPWIHWWRPWYPSLVYLYPAPLYFHVVLYPVYSSVLVYREVPALETGWVRFQVEPEEVEVYLDGKYLGMAWELEDRAIEAEAGNHTVKLVLGGYEVEYDLYVSPDGTSYFSRELAGLAVPGASIALWSPGPASP